MVFACIAEFDVHFSLVFVETDIQNALLFTGVAFCFCTTLPRFRRSGYPYQSTVPSKVISKFMKKQPLPFNLLGDFMKSQPLPFN